MARSYSSISLLFDSEHIRILTRNCGRKKADKKLSHKKRLNKIFTSSAAQMGARNES
jgi:hypothetical protein